jgi:hypothetical protein
VAARLGDDMPDGALVEVANQAARLRKQLDAVIALIFSVPSGGQPPSACSWGLKPD